MYFLLFFKETKCMTSRMTCFLPPVFYGNPCAPEKHGFREKKLNSDGSLFNQRACRRFQVCRQLCALMELSGRQVAMQSDVGNEGGSHAHLCRQVCRQGGALMQAGMQAGRDSYVGRYAGREGLLCRQVCRNYVLLCRQLGCSYVLLLRQLERQLRPFYVGWQVCTLMYAFTLMQAGIEASMHSYEGR